MRGELVFAAPNDSAFCQVVRTHFQLDTVAGNDLDVVHKKLYDSFVQEIDGVDNGIDPCTGDMNYQVTTTISSRVKRLAVPWTEEWTVWIITFLLYSVIKN